jgi:uncharacterized RDD family membrane protein YckC
LSLRASPQSAAASKDVACTGCLKLFREEEITRVGERNLCHSCQEAFSAKGQSPVPGAAAPGYGMPARKKHFEYGGFWVRVAAYLIDGIILGLILGIIVVPILMKVFSSMFASVPMADPSVMDQTQITEMATGMLRTLSLISIIDMVVVGGYFTLLEGGPGQTLGKKALGLKVVTPEGERIGYLKAFARYICKIVSSAILFIGFIIAAFDSEKRTLHDRICGTRVIKV